ncbi:MAG TPA: GatB/YqeY domain-containing protein [Anaerolineaceae bacterium]|nr:GatB/YqeY domain-containing protein [Anaerolineaceae bacterium]
MDNTLNFQDLLHAAMKEHDEVKKRVLRMLMSAGKLLEVNKGSKLDPQETQGLIQKEIKTRVETIADAEKANRADIVADTKAEIQYLETFLPKQLSDGELDALVSEVISEQGATSLKDMGKVMKALVPALDGRATSQRASQAVKSLLEKPN